MSQFTVQPFAFAKVAGQMFGSRRDDGPSLTFRYDQRRLVPNRRGERMGMPKIRAKRQEAYTAVGSLDFDRKQDARLACPPSMVLLPLRVPLTVHPLVFAPFVALVAPIIRILCAKLLATGSLFVRISRRIFPARLPGNFLDRLRMGGAPRFAPFGVMHQASGSALPHVLRVLREVSFAMLVSPTFPAFSRGRLSALDFGLVHRVHFTKAAVA